VERIPSLALVSAICLCCAGRAAASNVEVASSALRYVAAAGEANAATITQGTGAYTVSDVVAIAPGAGCMSIATPEPPPATAASCADSGIQQILVELGDGESNELTIVATVSATVSGGPGEDIVESGPGADTITGDAGDDELAGGAGGDTLRGGLGLDILAGGSDDDELLGEGGSDDLNGGAGNDRLIASAGKDVLAGGNGIDVLSGGSGNDKQTGGAGNDRLTGARGTDRLDGGAGNDTINSRDGAREVVRCGVGSKDLVTADKKDRRLDCERKRVR
jgi:Ca2+-binding RTX toxin-like protein